MQLQAATTKLQLLDQVKTQLVEVSWLVQWWQRPGQVSKLWVHQAVVKVITRQLSVHIKLSPARLQSCQGPAGGGELGAAGVAWCRCLVPTTCESSLSGLLMILIGQRSVFLSHCCEKATTGCWPAHLSWWAHCLEQAQSCMLGHL